MDSTRGLATRGFLIAVLVAGCSHDTSGVARQESNLKKLALFFGQYQGQHRGAWAADEKSLKDFIRAQEMMLKSQEITDVDGLFVSERDHQPYVILYGGELGTDGPGGSPVVAYEKQGVAGKRYVASSLGAVEEVDDQLLRQWVKNLP